MLSAAKFSDEEATGRDSGNERAAGNAIIDLLAGFSDDEEAARRDSGDFDGEAELQLSCCAQRGVGNVSFAILSCVTPHAYFTYKGRRTLQRSARSRLC